MRCSSLVFALTVALGGIASAQSPEPPEPMDTPDTDPAPPAWEPTPAPEPPPPQPAPAPAPPPPPPQPVVTASEPVSTGRPQGLSFGLGAGYDLPTSLETPNITSLRLRLPGGLQFEPFLNLSNTSSDTESLAGETTNKSTIFALGTNVRIPVISRGKVDFEVMGSVSFAHQQDNPEGDYNTVTTNSFTLGYGVAVAYWFSQHWNLTMNIINPIVSHDQAKQQVGPGMSNRASDTTVGLIFLPSVFMMLHLYN